MAAPTYPYDTRNPIRFRLSALLWPTATREPIATDRRGGDDNASTSDGAVTPTYVIEGAATTLDDNAFGACIDWGR